MGRRFLCCGCFGQPPGSWGDRGWVQRHKATLFITKLCFASKQPFPYPVTEATFQFLLSFICLTQLSQKGYSDTETFQGHLSIVSPAHCWGKSNKKTHPNPNPNITTTFFVESVVLPSLPAPPATPPRNNRPREFHVARAVTVLEKRCEPGKPRSGAARRGCGCGGLDHLGAGPWCSGRPKCSWFIPFFGAPFFRVCDPL